MLTHETGMRLWGFCITVKRCYNGRG